MSHSYVAGSRVTTQRRTLQGSIVNDLRAAILRGELKPGQPLRQGDVAALLGVSTTPVREALRQLATEGLADGDPHRGVTVHQMTKAELTEVYAIMIPLEQLAMKASSGKIAESARKRAVACIEEMDGSDSVADFALLNVEFHAILCEASGMGILAATLRRLRNLSALYVASAVVDQVGLRAEAGCEHRQLLDALVEGESDLAVDIATRHISRTRDERLQTLDS